jgi:hypothetical protein
MFKRILSSVAEVLGKQKSSSDPTIYEMGKASFVAPFGWQQASKSRERIVLRLPSGTRQITLSMMRLPDGAGMEAFQRVCQLRYAAEKKELIEGSIHPEEPVCYRDGRVLVMQFAGNDKRQGRVFSDILSYANGQITTLYLESAREDASGHAECMRGLVSSLKRY